MITWTKARHGAHWTGSTGTTTYDEKNKFGIQKVKPPHAPKWRHQRITKKEWHYEYVLYVRINGETHRLGERYIFITDAMNAADRYLVNGGMS